MDACVYLGPSQHEDDDYSSYDPHLDPYNPCYYANPKASSSIVKRSALPVFNLDRIQIDSLSLAELNKLIDKRKEEAGRIAQLAERRSKEEEFIIVNKIWEETDFSRIIDSERLLQLRLVVESFRRDYQRKRAMKEKCKSLFSNLQKNPTQESFTQYQTFSFNVALLGWSFTKHDCHWALVYPFNYLLTSDQKRKIRGRVIGYEETKYRELAEAFPEILAKDFPAPKSYRDGCEQLRQLNYRLEKAPISPTARTSIQFSRVTYLIEKIKRLLLYVKRNEASKTRLYTWEGADLTIRATSERKVAEYEWMSIVYRLVLNKKEGGSSSGAYEDISLSSSTDNIPENPHSAIMLQDFVRREYEQIDRFMQISNHKAEEQRADALWKRIDLSVVLDLEEIVFLNKFIYLNSSAISNQYFSLFRVLKAKKSKEALLRFQAFSINALLLGQRDLCDPFKWSLMFPLDQFLTPEHKQLIEGKLTDVKEEQFWASVAEYSQTLDQEFPPPKSYRDGCKQLEKLGPYLNHAEWGLHNHRGGSLGLAKASKMIKKAADLRAYVEANKENKTLIYTWRGADQKILAELPRQVNNCQWMNSIYNMALTELKLVGRLDPNTDIVIDSTDDSEL